MPKIVAYKCPHTGKVFEEKRKYDSHLRRLSRIRAHSRREKKEADKLTARWKEFRDSVTNIEMLPKRIIECQDLFWETAGRRRWIEFDVCRRTGIMPRLVEFIQFSLQFSESVSNTHSCPVDGVTNWGGRVEGAPRGYPGWSGHINWIVEWPRKHGGEYPGGDLFQGSRIHTGTGGGGHFVMRQDKDCQVFGYGVEIFGSDWEVMYTAHRKNCFIKELKGVRR